jgi:hypothetical protein
MIKFTPEIQKELITLSETKNLFLEGNIVKVINSNGDDNFKEYLTKCVERDTANRKKRLDITKQIQTQNKDLSNLNAENQKILEELQSTLKEVEDSKMTFEVQNRELNEWKADNIRLTEELTVEMVKSEKARIDAENAKNSAENDLDVLQKKTQFELINTIVRIALFVIVGVGLGSPAATNLGDGCRHPLGLPLDLVVLLIPIVFAAFVAGQSRDFL